MPKIVTVAAYKGGVGKTTLALELAYLLDAPLVDLDWDNGGATRRGGFRPTERSPLLDALSEIVHRGRARAGASRIWSLVIVILKSTSLHRSRWRPCWRSGRWSGTGRMWWSTPTQEVVAPRWGR